MNAAARFLYAIAAIIAVSGLALVVVPQILPADAPAAEAFAPAFPDAEITAKTYESLNDRPLFIPSRRSVLRPADQSQTETSTEAPPDMVLVGTLIGNGRRIAMIRQASDTGIATVPEGESFNGWLVETVREDAIILVSGSEKRLLYFPVKTEIKSPAAAPAAPEPEEAAQ